MAGLVVISLCRNQIYDDRESRTIQSKLYTIEHNLVFLMNPIKLDLLGTEKDPKKRKSEALMCLALFPFWFPSLVYLLFTFRRGLLQTMNKGLPGFRGFILRFGDDQCRCGIGAIQAMIGIIVRT